MRSYHSWIRGGIMPLAIMLAGCGGEGQGGGTTPSTPTTPTPPTPTPPGPTPSAFVGAVYAGTNNFGDVGNYVVAFGRKADGMLVPIDMFATGGTGRGVPRGATGPIRLNPLISEDSLLAVDDRYLLVVNAGSNTISSLRINADFTLTLVDQEPTGGTSPISIAEHDGVVYVANADEDGVFTGPPDQSGNISGLRLDHATGQLSAIAGSSRSLGARPADVAFTPDGAHILVSALNAGSARLPDRPVAELTSYGVMSDGTLTAAPRGIAASTPRGNAANRNLPNAIGIAAFARSGRQYVVAAEARTVSAAGQPGTFETLQTGSISTWEVRRDGAFIARAQDFLLGPSPTSGPTQAGWIALAPNASAFWVSTATGATISGFGLADDGAIGRGGLLVRGAPIAVGAASPLADADGFVDIAVSGDGRYLYQLVGLKGRIDVFEIDTLVSTNIILRQRAATDLLPMDNLQGIAAVGARAR